MEFDKLKYLISERIQGLKDKFGSNTFDEKSLGLLQGYYDVQKLINQVEVEETVIHNAYEAKEQSRYVHL